LGVLYAQRRRHPQIEGPDLQSPQLALINRCGFSAIRKSAACGRIWDPLVSKQKRPYGARGDDTMDIDPIIIVGKVWF
jgi:hypothetical protein